MCIVAVTTQEAREEVGRDMAVTWRGREYSTGNAFGVLVIIVKLHSACMFLNLSHFEQIQFYTGKVDAGDYNLQLVKVLTRQTPHSGLLLTFFLLVLPPWSSLSCLPPLYASHHIGKNRTSHHRESARETAP